MEGFNLGSIVAHIKADASQFNLAMDEAKMKGGGFGAVLSGVGDALKVVAVGAGIAAGAATVFGAVSVKAYSESQDKLTQLNAVLQSTGGVAGWTANQAIELSKALQKVTKFSDEDVLSVENLLLTFTSIGKDIMPQATETVLNMATALGEDTKSASIQLGKALQDPVLGITALRRVGVNFNDSQKEVIKNLVETGQKSKAQALILKELQTEFGGSAKAAGDTFAGSLAKLKNSLNDVEESVGKVIVERLTPFITKALQAVASVDWEKVINKTINALKEFWNTLDRVWWKIDSVYQRVSDYLTPKLDELRKAFEDFYPTIRTFIDQYINPLIEALGGAAGKALVWAMGAVIDIAKILLKDILTPLFKFMDDNKLVVYALAGMFAALKVEMMLGAAFDAIRVAFVVFQTVQVPSMMATLSTLGAAFWAAFPLAAIAAAAVIAFEKINEAAKKTLAVMDSTRSAIVNASNSEDAAAQRIKDAYNAGTISRDAYIKATNEIYLGHKALGGPVSAMTPYIVGERGPELFMPSSNGTIIPNNQLNKGQQITTNINGTINIGSEVDADNFLRRLTYNQELSMKGLTPVK